PAALPPWLISSAWCSPTLPCLKEQFPAGHFMTAASTRMKHWLFSERPGHEPESQRHSLSRRQRRSGPPIRSEQSGGGRTARTGKQRIDTAEWGAPMLKARVIPCLDVKDGRVVKGVQFVDLIDAGDPVQAARAYDEAGADELCFLDITASHENRGIIFDVVAETAEHCFMPLTVGGGVRAVEDVRKLLLAGADKVSINTAAVTDRAFVSRAAEKFGSQCIVVAIDARRVSKEGEAD